MDSFEKLVRELDDQGLADLSAALARQTEARHAADRRRANGIQLEDIHAGMAEDAKRRATEEIARVLRGEE
jgi:hypothetical protein